MQAIDRADPAHESAHGAHDDRREYVSPVVEVLGTWQAVALASSYTNGSAGG